MAQAQSWDRWLTVEGVGLTLGTLWLIFPTLLPNLTYLTLIGLTLLWTLQWLKVRRPLLPPSPLRKWIVLFTVFVFVGIIASADWAFTLPKATNLFLGLAIFRLAQFYGVNASRARHLIWLYLALGFIFVLVGSMSAAWVLELDFLGPIYDRLPTGLVRLPESAPAGVETNQLGSVPLLFIPLALLLALAPATSSWRPGRMGRSALLFYTVGMLAIVFISQSRSAWIGAAAGLLLLLGLTSFSMPPSPLRRRLRLAFGLLVAGGSVTLLLIAPTLAALWIEAPAETVIGTLTTVNVRKEVWRWAAAAIADFPLTGVGLGTFRVVVHRLYPIATPIDYDIAHAHNIFLQVALDIGLPGLFAYCGLLASGVSRGWRVARRADQLWPLANGLVAGIISLHLYGLTDCPALGAKPWVTLWLALAILTVLHQISQQPLVETGADLPRNG